MALFINNCKNSKKCLILNKLSLVFAIFELRLQYFLHSL